MNSREIDPVQSGRDRSIISPLLIGRTHEVALLEQALSSVQQRNGRCILVAGEAGIGKSRLLAEVRARAASTGLRILEGQCFEQDVSFPYAPLIDALRALLVGRNADEIRQALGQYASELVKLLPELTATLPDIVPTPAIEPEAEKRRLFETILQFLVRLAPVLLIVEDVHWSDEISLEFLLYLARRITTQPILLLVSYRPIDSSPMLAEFLAEFERQRLATELALARLDSTDTEAVIRAIFGLRRRVNEGFLSAVYELTEGNPFFIEEILKSLVATQEIYLTDGFWEGKPLIDLHIPRTIQIAVQRHSEHLTPTAGRLLKLAAVVGRRFDYELLAQLTNLQEHELQDGLRELITAQFVVEESAGQLAYRHALMREAVYSDLLAHERQTLHHVVGDTMEQLYAETLDARLADLAYQFYQAGRWAKAAHYAHRAGDRARLLYAPRTAVQHYTRAIDAASRLSNSLPWTLYHLRGQVFDTLGNFDQARTDYETALRMVRSAYDPKTEWQLLLDLGFLWSSRDQSQASDYYQQALERARQLHDSAALGHTLNRVGNWHLNSGNLKEALNFHLDALMQFDVLADRPGIAATLDLLGMTTNLMGDRQQAVAYYEQAIAVFRELDNRQALASTLANLALQNLKISDAQEAVELARAIHWRSGEAYALSCVGSLAYLKGHIGEALEIGTRTLEIATDIEHRLWATAGHLALGVLHFELLAFEQATNYLERTLALATATGNALYIHYAIGLLGFVYVQQGQPERAEKLLAQELQTPEPWAALVGGVRVLLALARHDPVSALALLDQLEGTSILMSGPLMSFAGEISRVRGEVLVSLGRLDEAVQVVQKAFDTLRALDIHVPRWRLYLILGKAHLAAGRRDEAEQAFGAAQEDIQRIAESVPDQALRDTFVARATAMFPTRRPPTASQIVKKTYGGLTRRECQVAAEVALGKSNREIADTLAVSLKTVEAHISRILSKLGYSSRAQIAVWAVEKGLSDAADDLDTL